jgi:3-hydroxyacyl-CoA dehydrogenase/enoyl-CoA hydratase/3-hydroxybutyryl-CoA epimerase
MFSLDLQHYVLVEAKVELSLSSEKTKPLSQTIAPNIEAITIKPEGDFAWVELNLPGEKINKLSSPLMLRLKQVIAELSTSNYKCAVFISRKPNIFIAGADIEEIKALKTCDDAENACLMGQGIFRELENLKIPTIAAIHGACVGGGCEMILACDYRIATNDPSTKIGLPEVNLGVLPGFGGTQRLPRLIGLQAAFDIILAGKTVPAQKALKVGLVDKCVPKEILEKQARIKVLEILKSGGKKRSDHYKPRGMQNKLLESFLGKYVIYNQVGKTLSKRPACFYPAPRKAFEVVKATYGGNIEKGYAKEAKAFGELAVTDISKNLIHIYYMTEGVKKQTGVSSDVKPNEVKSVGVLGAGTMGGGIAQLAAERDISVRLKDISLDAIGKGLKAAADIFSKALKRRKINKYEYQRKNGLISGGTDYSGFKSIDVVIEAIVEDLNVKKKVLAELETFTKPEVILASNTSSLSISEMSKALARPENFAGMHFFNPVHRMPLIEVIRGEKTSDLACATVYALSKKMGKTPIVVKDGPGFLVNRLLMPYLNEACYVLSDGASVETIDKALLDFGMPMGPLHLIDEIGIDVAAKVAKILHQGLGIRAEAGPLMNKVVDAKKLGKKNGSGFYLYDSSGKKLSVDPKLYEILGLKTPTNPFTKDEIVHRVLFPMINEAAQCLEENVVTSAEAVDLGMIMGTGFPPFRGGILKWADKLGSEKIADELEMLASKHGERFKPTAPLLRMAKSNKRFYR